MKNLFIEYKKGELLLNRYEICRTIGRGGMACVYEVTDHHYNNRKLALKVLTLEKDQCKWITEDKYNELCKRFINEIDILRDINHDHIVKAYDFSRFNDQYYYSMEYIEGYSLEKSLEEKNVIPPREVLKIIKAVCSALHCTHQKNILHRDIKPSNIIIRKRDNHVFVVDFGIAKLLDKNDITLVDNSFIGTPKYMSPEQQSYESLDHRVDIYSTGILVYKMLTGNFFQYTNSTQKESNLQNDIYAVINKAAAYSPSDRYDSILDFYHDIESVILKSSNDTLDESSLLPGDNNINKKQLNDNLEKNNEIDSYQFDEKFIQDNTERSEELLKDTQIINKPFLNKNSNKKLLALIIIFFIIAFTLSFIYMIFYRTLTINSSPEKAHVYIEGILKGETPISVRLPYGKYDVLLMKDGYYNWEAQLINYNNNVYLISLIKININENL